jgi:hypothetical protein
MGAKVHWDEGMLATLRAMRSQGHTLYVCAERIGVCYPHTVYKARELGIANRMNRGQRPGLKIRAGRQA